MNIFNRRHTVTNGNGRHTLKVFRVDLEKVGKTGANAFWNVNVAIVALWHALVTDFCTQILVVFAVEEDLLEKRHAFRLTETKNINRIARWMDILTRLRNFSRMNGLKIAKSMLNKYELLTMCTAFKRSDSVSCTHDRIMAANDGVNCMM